MNDDLATLDGLDLADRELARVEAELSKLTSRFGGLERGVVDASAAVQAAATALDANKAEERQLTRRLEELRTNRESALRVLTTGVGNPEAAQRQLERCDALIDEAETATLETLDRQDAFVAALQRAETVLQSATRARDAEAEAQPEHLRRLGAAKATATTARTALLGALAADLKPRYEAFRERGRFAVARVKTGPASGAPAGGGSCEACAMAVQPQMIADLRNNKLVACHGCHRWLVVSA